VKTSGRIKKGKSTIGLPPLVSPQHGANSEDPFFKSEIIVATIDQTISVIVAPVELTGSFGKYFCWCSCFFVFMF
jgi:hypothetical protein